MKSDNELKNENESYEMNINIDEDEMWSQSIIDKLKENMIVIDAEREK